MEALVALLLAALAPLLPTGPPPQVAYGFSANPTFEGGDWELVRADGSRQPLPNPPAQLVVYDDRVINGYGTEGGFVVEVVDATGQVVERRDGLCHYGLATDADHGEVAWLEGRTMVTLADEGTREVRRRVVPPIERPICASSDPVSLDGSRLYLTGDRTIDPFYVRPGRFAISVESLARISDAAGRQVVGRRAAPSTCSAVTNVRGELRWQTCDHRLLDLAPDGRHVLGITGPSRYGRAKAVSFFDRKGRLVGQWQRPTGARIEEVRWEDGAHALAVVQDARGWSLVRIGLDGMAEYAVAPQAVEALDRAPFALPMS